MGRATTLAWRFHPFRTHWWLPGVGNVQRVLLIGAVMPANVRGDRQEDQ